MSRWICNLRPNSSHSFTRSTAPYFFTYSPQPVRQSLNTPGHVFSSSSSSAFIRIVTSSCNCSLTICLLAFLPLPNNLIVLSGSLETRKKGPFREYLEGPSLPPLRWSRRRRKNSQLGDRFECQKYLKRTSRKTNSMQISRVFKSQGSSSMPISSCSLTTSEEVATTKVSSLSGLRFYPRFIGTTGLFIALLRQLHFGPSEVHSRGNCVSGSAPRWTTKKLRNQLFRNCPGITKGEAIKGHLKGADVSAN